MAGELKIGAVLRHRDFEFEDGTKRDKYLVVLGAKPGRDYLCALTTSKQWRIKAERGCQRYFFVRGDGKNFFPKDTWVVLSAPVIMSRAEAAAKIMKDILQIEGNLKENIIGEIRHCLKGSRDISRKQKQLL
ncbi:MAG: hypothetical protein OXU31_08010 [Gammaproteobacteria bacterium]|nr:hypothetical protein [Gammaproteobacteria bacterium]MDD9815899.1 hypothetical protein [Gammaproteobacteria bacterium]